MCRTGLRGRSLPFQLPCALAINVHVGNEAPDINKILSSIDVVLLVLIDKSREASVPTMHHNTSKNDSSTKTYIAVSYSLYISRYSPYILIQIL